MPERYVGQIAGCRLLCRLPVLTDLFPRQSCLAGRLLSIPHSNRSSIECKRPAEKIDALKRQVPRRTISSARMELTPESPTRETSQRRPSTWYSRMVPTTHSGCASTASGTASLLASCAAAFSLHKPWKRLQLPHPQNAVNYRRLIGAFRLLLQTLLRTAGAKYTIR